MFCPECGAEFREGIDRCVDCDLPLGPIDPNEPEVIPPLDLVTVLASGNPALLAVAQSLLQDRGIPYCLKGDQIQDLFGWGRMGAGYNILVGPAQLQVVAPDAEAAEALLRDLAEVDEDALAPVDAEFDDAAEAAEKTDEPVR